MELIRGLANLQQQITACVATIGNFDGIHLGHSAIVRRVIDKANELGLSSYVLLFEPHPKEFFLKDKCPPRLTCFREKYSQLETIGIDKLIVLQFNQSIREMKAQDFIDAILIDKLRVRHLVVGDDFHFGHKRQGNFKLLEEKAGKQYSLEPTPSVVINKERVSSTLIRDALAGRQLKKAEKMLGRRYSMTGRVGYGNQLGRQLNFPTANVAVKRKKIPLSGVFLVKCYWSVSGVMSSAWGAANCGSRPTVDGHVEKLEVHLLGVNQDLYGIDLTVEFWDFIREEQKFNDVTALKLQISKDIVRAEHLIQEYGS